MIAGRLVTVILSKVIHPIQRLSHFDILTCNAPNTEAIIQGQFDPLHGSARMPDIPGRLPRSGQSTHLAKATIRGRNASADMCSVCMDADKNVNVQTLRLLHKHSKARQSV